MPIQPIFLSTLPTQTDLIDQVLFISLGFAVVLIVLSLLALITASLGIIFQRLDKQSTPSKNQSQASSSLKKTAVIAAAVDKVIDKPHHIQSIK